MIKRLIALFISLLPLYSLAQVSAIDSFVQLYPEEYGVITKQYHRIEFYLEQGELKARQSIVREKLPLKESHFSVFATESVVHHYFSELKSLEAYTLIPKGKDFQKLKINNVKVKTSKTENIFYDDNKESEIAFTNIVLGNRMQLNYSLYHRDAHLLPRFFLQNYLPIHHFKMEIVYPKGMHVEIKQLGGHASWMKQDKKISKNTITETIEAHRVPKFKVYSSSAPITSYVPHVALIVRDYEDPKTKTQRKYITNAEDLNTYLYQFIKDVNTGVSPEIAQEAKNITKGIQTNREKAEKIFKWVQQHIRYVAFEDSLGGFVPRQAELVYKRKFGDCKDMSSILQSMLAAVDIPAHLTWIGTRDIPYTIADMPVPSSFNHMICALQLDGQWLFLDATDNTTPFGAYPHHLQSKEAFINQGPSSFDIVKLPVVQVDKNVQYDTTFLQIQGDKLQGRLSIRYQGYTAWELITKLKYSNKNTLDNTFNSIVYRGNNKFKHENLQHAISDTVAKEVSIQANIQLDGYMNKVGDQYYLNMHLMKYFANAKVEKEDMQVPMRNDYKKTIVQVVQLEIPQDYQVTYAPPSLQYQVEGVGSVNVQYLVKDQQIQMINEINLDYIEILPNKLEAFNTLVDKMLKAYRESIELSPKNS